MVFILESNNETNTNTKSKKLKKQIYTSLSITFILHKFKHAEKALNYQEHHTSILNIIGRGIKNH